jgi:hypothetical protein
MVEIQLFQLLHLLAAVMALPDQEIQILLALPVVRGVVVQLDSVAQMLVVLVIRQVQVHHKVIMGQLAH